MTIEQRLKKLESQIPTMARAQEEMPNDELSTLILSSPRLISLAFEAREFARTYPGKEYPEGLVTLWNEELLRLDEVPSDH
ncbi:MAG: hypothetical protein WCP87_01485 [Atribacterota bacterium]